MAGKGKQKPWYLLNCGSIFPLIYWMEPGSRPSSR